MTGARHERQQSTQPSAQQSGPLPPKPDPWTGIPEPPSAPAYHGPDVLAGYSPVTDRRFRRLPRPPDGMGAVLSWYRLNRRGWLVRFGLALLALTAGGAVVSLLRGDGVALLAAWPVWPLLVVGAGLMAGPTRWRSSIVSVGADWLQRDGVCVRTYQLTEIEGGYDPTWLRLRDGHASLTFTLDELHRERAAWNLLYNGIRHSIATGARLTPTAARLLELDPG